MENVKRFFQKNKKAVLPAVLGVLLFSVMFFALLGVCAGKVQEKPADEEGTVLESLTSSTVPGGEGAENLLPPASEGALTEPKDSAKENFASLSDGYLSPDAASEPMAEPSEEPSSEPTEEPTAEPTEEPTAEPTEKPTAEPTEEPSVEPTEEPTAEPTEEPTAEPTEEPTGEPTEEPSVEPSEEPEPTPGESPLPEEFLLTVYNHEKGIVETVLFEDYVARALQAEMSGNSPMEALKAQAIAIRSYILSNASVRYECHYGAMTCDDYTHCMACLSEEEFATLNETERSRCLEAVRSTEGQILTYKGRVITAYFHWCSYGYTASCQEVFGNYVPYLQSVYSPVEKEMVKVYRFSSATLLEELFGSVTAEKYLSGGAFPLGMITETESGRVDTVYIYGVPVKGVRLRQAVGLRSTKFDVSYNPDKEEFTFVVYGSGHGVGMSQWGAIALANEGKSYAQILYYYYKDTVLALMNKNLFPGQ